MTTCKHGHPTPFGKIDRCSQCHAELARHYYHRRKLDDPLGHRLTSIIINMRRRKECTVTVQDLVEIWEQQEGKCAYCGVEMTVNSGGRIPTTVSVDRIDPAIPYHFDNIVLACWRCNAAKGTATKGEFTEWCKRIAQQYGEDA